MSAPAGWYDDGNGQQRWWDGQTWTEHVWGEDRSHQEPGFFNKLSASVKKAASNRAAARQALKQEQINRKQSAGALVTRGVFGKSMVEIYEAGFVRVHTGSTSIPKNCPYEKLISIIFSCPNSKSSSSAASPMETAAAKTVSSFIKGGKHLMRTTAAGLAVSGVAHVVKSMSGKSTLTIATDKEIHTLTNQDESELGITIVRREHEDIGRSLEQAGQSVLSANSSGLASGSAEPVLALPGSESAQPLPKRAALEPSPITERMHELANLHDEGILDDAEFAVAKAKLLGNL